MEDLAKVIEDLKQIIDEIERKNPGFKERWRRNVFSTDKEASVFEAIDSACEIVEEDKVP